MHVLMMCPGRSVRGVARLARPPSAVVGLRGLYPGKGRGRAAAPDNVRVAGVLAAEGGEAAESPAGAALGSPPEEQAGASGEWTIYLDIYRERSRRVYSCQWSPSDSISSMCPTFIDVDSWTLPS